ncbi:LysR family transcriptional regulator [Acetobacter estunensis NRIC 0472]|uniref:LysR family transcriptional regulator n=1 Tax=Acetobacter estunensis TaxID=104097 RepID=A0A967B8K2_9PROT|nr:LysR family transcriptional regulator [Acetobacter estunensis]NHO54031.1 LysR family transcriptional regulator [Acetobacter estunensis]GBQ24063.1 LysR family transcriptional regulator [Acetobacter estunensis NRIC 0472]
MELRHLRYFVAVAEHGSFTRAAGALGMEQPPLSQQIKQFERLLGATLFHRMTRGVELTEVGATLLPQAQAILSMSGEFLALAQGLSRGERGHLRVGLAGAVSLLPIIPQVIRRFRETWPEVVVSFEESNTPALSTALHERRVDVAVVRPPMMDEDNLAVYPLLDEPTVAALPSGHTHAGDGAIRLSMLEHEPLIIFPRELGPGFHDAILSACQNAGFTPRMGQQAPQIAATVPLVAAGLGVSVVPRSLSQIHAGGVTFHPIEEPAPRASLAIAVLKGHPTPLVSRFVSTLREACREWDDEQQTMDPSSISALP